VSKLPLKDSLLKKFSKKRKFIIKNAPESIANIFFNRVKEVGCNCIK
jgi:hypothetical protein